jgi:hypothetical protein
MAPQVHVSGTTRTVLTFVHFGTLLYPLAPLLAGTKGLYWATLGALPVL